MRRPVARALWRWRCGCTASAIPSWIIPAGGRAIPPRSPETSRNGSSTSCTRRRRYNGPPPNYVELELQIVPFLAAALYKVFGVHEIFGRLITLAFSLGNRRDRRVFRALALRSDSAGLDRSVLLRGLSRQRLLRAHLYARLRDGLLLDLRRSTPPRACSWIDDRLECAQRCRDDRCCSTLAYLANRSQCSRWCRCSACSGSASRSKRRLHRCRGDRRARVVPLLILWLYDRRVASYASGTGPAASRGCTCFPRCARR